MNDRRNNDGVSRVWFHDLMPLAIALTLLLSCFRPTARGDDSSFRTWTDKTGNFQVEARLIKVADGKVALLKRDGLAITVPLEALSAADQQHLQKMAPASPNPFAGGVPLTPAPDTPPAPASGLLVSGDAAKELTAGQTVIALSDADAMPPLVADPRAAPSEFHPLNLPLEPMDAYAKASAPIVVESQGPTFAVSIHRVGNAVSPAHFGRIHLVRGKQKPQVVLDLKETVKLFDHHEASGRSLIAIGVDSPSERGGDLLLLDKLATGQPTALARWKLPGWNRPGFKPKIEFARLLDAERAVVQVNDAVYLWRMTTGEPLARIDRIRAGGKLQVSGGGKYLVVPTSKAAQIVDLQEGQMLGAVSFPSTLTPETSFSPDGTKLALVGGNQFVVWDVENGVVASEGTVPNPSGVLFGWIGEQFLLTQLAGLIDPQLGMSLWYYGVPSNNLALAVPGGVVAVERTGTLLALPVPHGPVAEVQRKLSSGDDQLLLIRPGSEVSLKVEAVEGVDQQQMLQSLQASVERSGWKVNPQSPIELVATIERGETQKLHFRPIGSPLRGPHETVKIRPYTATLVVRRGADELWKRSSTNMVPSFLRLEAGETLKQAVKKYEKADPAYFSRVVFPPKILRPEVAQSVGRSRIADGVWVDFFPR